MYSVEHNNVVLQHNRMSSTKIDKNMLFAINLVKYVYVALSELMEVTASMSNRKTYVMQNYLILNSHQLHQLCKCGSGISCSALCFGNYQCLLPPLWLYNKISLSLPSKQCWTPIHINLD